MSKITKTISLNNGIEIPRIGLGVWKIENSQVETAIKCAIDTGYRHIDTAKVYGNESGVGDGIKNCGISRSKLSVTTKLAVQDIRNPKKAISESLKKLDLKYVDLYLIHWPFLGWRSAWKIMEKIYHSGEARAIGVSNFGIKELEHIRKTGGLTPAVNQVEISPYLSRKELIKYCQSNGIVVEAYSPLTRGKRLGEKFISDIAQKYQKSPAQILIRWGLQHGLVMLPKSQNPDHIKANIDVYDFEIVPADMNLLDSLNANYSALFPFWSRK